MFRGRQFTTNNCLIIANRHLLFIDKQIRSNKKCNAQLQQRQFGSLKLLGVKDKKQPQKHEVGINKLVLLEEQQKRFFAAETSFSHSFDDEQQGQGKQKIEKGTSEEQKLPLYRPKKWFRLDYASQVNLNLRQGETMKFFHLTKEFYSFANSSNNVAMYMALEVGYPFVNAMDNLLSTLAVKYDYYSSELLPGPLVLESQRISAYFYDFQLELVQLGNAYRFTIKTIKEDHTEQEMQLPIRALPWLREIMAHMLAEHDGSQLLGPAPPELPESIKQAPLAVQKRTRFRDQKPDFPPCIHADAANAS